MLGIAQHSPLAADRIRVEFHERLGILSLQPGIGHFHDELLGPQYRFWNFYSHVVVYEWQTKPIRIIRIVHGARELGALLSARTDGRSLRP